MFLRRDRRTYTRYTYFAQRPVANSRFRPRVNGTRETQVHRIYIYIVPIYNTHEEQKTKLTRTNFAVFSRVGLRPHAPQRHRVVSRYHSNRYSLTIGYDQFSGRKKKKIRSYTFLLYKQKRIRADFSAACTCGHGERNQQTPRFVKHVIRARAPKKKDRDRVAELLICAHADVQVSVAVQSPEPFTQRYSISVCWLFRIGTNGVRTAKPP